jgi:putative membrane protein
MTLPLERSQTRRPISWLTLLGVLLLPAVIGGILVAALYNPTERLDAMNTAIVNNDEPVEIDGQTTPLGRLLTAGLVEGSDDLDSNLTWTISNDDDATEGLEDGTYDAIVTIPENFSAAATSTAPGGDPERATIELTTSPDARIVDDAITTQVTQTAASVLGEQLTSTYLENVFLGFTTLGDQLGEAADGASQLADGASTAADGGYSLADGVRQLQTGADGIATGAAGLAGGAADIADGAAQLADGAGTAADGIGTLSGGAGQLASGASQTAAGLDVWAAGARPVADGTQQLADGLAEAAAQTAAIPAIPSDIVDGLKALTSDGEQNADTVEGIVDALAAAAAACDAEVSGAELCDSLTDASADATVALPGLTAAVSDSAQLAEDIDAIANFGPTLNAGLEESAAAAQELATGMTGLADGADQLATGAEALATGASGIADGAGQAASGVRQLADGADRLSSGADQLSSGAGQLATGAQALATGAGSAADGSEDLADGVDEIADGTGDLADGLDQAVDGVPSYTDAQAADLASIVADPVVADGTGTSLFGASAVPLLATLALWFGGLASFVVLQAVPRAALTSRRSSVALALRALAPGVAVGALQGVLVAVVVQLAAGYDLGAWAMFAGMCVVAGVAFAAVNHALVALFGGIGRWISALVGVLAVATGIVSTVPGTLLDVAGLVPTAPAYTAMLAALTDASGGAAAAGGLVLWTVLAVGASVLAVTRHRSTSARAVLAQPA